MSDRRAKIRLFVDSPLGPDQQVILNRDQVHYVFGVMRLTKGDLVAVFNGRDGEWQSRVTEAGKRQGVLQCAAQTSIQTHPPDLWLLFAPIKKAGTDFIVEKATELGVAEIWPVQTNYSNAESVRQDRLQAHAVEAVEQCGGVYVPPVHALTLLSAVLQNWPFDRKLLFCDESTAGQPIAELAEMSRGKWAILIGPEDGFSPMEVSTLQATPQVVSMSLGPRILRADTAAVAALTLWQAALGDWNRL